LLLKKNKESTNDINYINSINECASEKKKSVYTLNKESNIPEIKTVSVRKRARCEMEESDDDLKNSYRLDCIG